MTLPVELGQVIAERRFTLDPDGAVVVRIGLPVTSSEAHHDSCCPYQIDGIGSGKMRCIYGVDAIQALWLTLRTIGAELYTSDEYEAGRLRLHEEGPPDPDLCLPVPRGMEDLLPPWPPPRPDDHVAPDAS